MMGPRGAEARTLQPLPIAAGACMDRCTR